MSLEIWLRRGRKVNVGGRDLYMMPLPLQRCYGIGEWVEEQSKGVLNEAVEDLSPTKNLNPLVIISKVMMKIDVAELATTIFNLPEDPVTGKPVNDPPVTKEWITKYFDIPTAHECFLKFIEINQLEELIKNLRSLPVVKKIMEVADLTYGIPFLNSLPQSITSNRIQSEGSQSPRSTSSSRPEESDSRLSTESLKTLPIQ